MLANAKTLTMLWRGLPILALLATLGPVVGQPAESLDSFITALRSDATARGITRATFDAGMAGVTPDLAVIAAMRREPEYGKPLAAYLAGLVSPGRILTGQQKYAQWADTLHAIEGLFGVDGAVLVSIWGMKSSFGESRDHWDVFRSLATLAQARFQHPLFRNELLSALTILQKGGIPRQQFVGSWAGAMGQPQFLPSSYLTYAVAFAATDAPTYGPARLTHSPQSQTICRNSAGSPACRGASRSLRPRGSTTRRAAARSKNGLPRFQASGRSAFSSRRRCNSVLPKRRRGTSLSRHWEFRCH